MRPCRSSAVDPTERRAAKIDPIPGQLPGINTRHGRPPALLPSRKLPPSHDCYVGTCISMHRHQRATLMFNLCLVVIAAVSIMLTIPRTKERQSS